MNELLQKTVSQIVTEHHQTAPVFQKYGIDFCCKGKRPLAEACNEKQLSKEAVLAELQNAIGGARPGSVFDRLTLTALVEHIVQVHHHYVRTNAPQIQQYVSNVALKHGHHFPYMHQVAALFEELRTELDSHMLKEEKILFPRILQLEKEGFSNHAVQYFEGPISVMEAEHDKAGAIMEQIRELTSGYTAPADACTTFRLSLASLQAFEADLHQHVHLENHLLFPKTVALFAGLPKPTA